MFLFDLILYGPVNNFSVMSGRAGTIRLSSDAIRIAIHAMRYDTYHDISTQTQLHLEALFL